MYKGKFILKFNKLSLINKKLLIGKLNKTISQLCIFRIY